MNPVLCDFLQMRQPFFLEAFLLSLCPHPRGLVTLSCCVIVAVGLSFTVISRMMRLVLFFPRSCGFTLKIFLIFRRLDCVLVCVTTLLVYLTVWEHLFILEGQDVGAFSLPCVWDPQVVPSQRPRAAASALRPSSLCCCCFLAESCLTFKTPWTVACQAPRPWNSPGRNTGVGCHLLLQGMLVALHCGWTLHR